jgi:hypothetical protein
VLESKGEIGFSIQSQVMYIKVVINNFVDDAHFLIQNFSPSHYDILEG